MPHENGRVHINTGEEDPPSPAEEPVVNQLQDPPPEPDPISPVILNLNANPQVLYSGLNTLISEVQRDALNFLDGYAFIDNPIQKKILQRTIVESAWVFAGLQLRGISATTNEPAEEEIDVVDLGEVTLDQAFQIEQEVENLETPVDQNLDSLFTTLIAGPGGGDLIDPGEAGASGVSVLGVTGGGLLGAGSGDALGARGTGYPANPAGESVTPGASVYPDGGHNDGGDIGD